MRNTEDQPVTLRVAVDALSTDSTRRYEHESPDDFLRRKERHTEARKTCAYAINAAAKAEKP